MGKRRDEAERKIDEFIERMNLYAKQCGSARTVHFSKKVRVGLIHEARAKKKTIEEILELVRPAIEQTIATIEGAKVTGAKGFSEVVGFSIDPTKLH